MNKENLSLLGQENVPYPTTYSPQILEKFKNKHPKHPYFVKFNAPEFTSLCPITGQPDLQLSIFPTFRKTFLSKASL